ncbi:MAG TPA: MBOAT family O-acyltransferase [Candidatus Acidoferrum sp.]|nr:MBOAT family O-acyltransferase [Candidatus Acidoferrum sp.]
MTFNSVPYLFFLAIAVAVFWLLPARFRHAFVLLASLGFYGLWGFLFVWIPLLVAGIVYLAGRQLTANPAGQKQWTRFGISFVLLLLIVFKYRGFLFSILAALGVSTSFHGLSLATSIAFPMGISFYTFEAIAYLIDLRQGRVKMPGLFDLCLFFLFWPNILSGPIVRARELMPQLVFTKPFEPRFCFEGLDRLIWGLVQKNVIANMLGIWVDWGFGAGSTAIPSTLDSWGLAVAFGLQIYFDFAAYTNMAIGAARLIGVTLPENFRQPYHAATPPDFWNRWHMTLSRWIRDYLFFPLNAKWAGASGPLYVSLIGVMALVGLWHGAGWGFILWGVLHGAYLVGYRIYEKWRAGRPSVVASRIAANGWRVLTMVAITAAWVPFRAPTLHKAATILSSMFYRFVGGRAYDTGFYVFTGALILFCGAEPWLFRKLGEMEDRAGADGPSPFHIVVRPVAYAFGLLLFLVFDEHNGQFIYSQF